MTEEEARQFGRKWVDAWNGHDLDEILSHYADDIEFSSPFVVKLLNLENCVIWGKDALRYYFSRAMVAYPELHFELHNVLAGASSLVVYYSSVNDQLAAEMMILDPDGRVSKVWAHYCSRH